MPAVDTTSAPGDRLTTMAVVTRLVSRISRGDRPLGVIADSLGELASTLDAQRVVVAIDDPRLGRQVFTSARVPLGTEPVGLFGAPGTWTEPAGRLDGDEADLVTATVGAAVHALLSDSQGAQPGQLAQAAQNAPIVLPAGMQSRDAVLRGAAERARAYGWSFTLALVRFDDGDHGSARAGSLQSGLRPGDTAMSVGDGGIIVLLPAVRDESAASVLADAIRSRELPRCAFGLVRCPEDAADAASLLGLARRRLDDALTARNPSEGPI